MSDSARIPAELAWPLEVATCGDGCVSLWLQSSPDVDRLESVHSAEYRKQRSGLDNERSFTPCDRNYDAMDCCRSIRRGVYDGPCNADASHPDQLPSNSFPCLRVLPGRVPDRSDIACLAFSVGGRSNRVSDSSALLVE